MSNSWLENRPIESPIESLKNPVDILKTRPLKWFTFEMKSNSVEEVSNLVRFDWKYLGPAFCGTFFMPILVIWSPAIYY